MSTYPVTDKGSVFGGAVRMAVLSLLLFWLPFFGPAIAGFFGGRHSGSITRAMASIITLFTVIGLMLYYFSSSLISLPFVAEVLSLGTTIILLATAGPLFLGGILGGIFHK